jgi:aldehyde:ferredoxin oxidoreductase
VIQCSNSVYAEDGSEIVSCVEYESDWALGANCGIDDLDGIARLVYWCNAYGVDTIEAGDSIAVAMDSGYLPFGDLEGATALLHEMGKGTPIGRILGGGTGFTAKAFGNPRSPSVKGQGMPAYEPRAVKGIGVTYATTTMGADHTAGYTIAPEIAGVGGKSDPLLSDPAKADLSRAFQMTTAFSTPPATASSSPSPSSTSPAALRGWWKKSTRWWGQNSATTRPSPWAVKSSSASALSTWPPG